MQSRLVSWCILGFLLLSGIPNAAMAALYIVQEGDDLQEAIDAASTGDTLQVENGTYPGNFVVTKSLTLQGMGMPVLDGKDTLNADTITLLGGGIQLEGFRITGAARAGVNVSSIENLIRNNEVLNNDQFAIAVWGTGNVIEGNNCSRTAGSIRNGIGIYLSRSSGSRVVNNTVLDNGKNGIQISYSSSLILEGNRISGIGGRTAGGHGIRLENSAFIVARDNQIRDCLTDGLYLFNASHGIFHEVLVDNTSTGIFLSGIDNSTFERITVQNNRVGMDVSASGTLLPLQVIRSSFINNTQHARLTGSVTVWNSSEPLAYTVEGRYYENYTGNFWDDCSCEDANGDGIGDLPCPVSAGDFDPYPLCVPFVSYDWDADPPDTTPPCAVVNLTGDSPDPYTYVWTWEDPTDDDLDHLVLYLNDTFLMNLTQGTETLTLDTLSPSTPYTLGIQTVDTAGNLNLSTVDYTGYTDDLPVPTPSSTPAGTPSEPVTSVPTLTAPSQTTAPISTSPPGTTSPPPPSRGTSRKNTRYIPPPSSTDPPTPTSLPTISEETPPSPELYPDTTVPIAETVPERMGDGSSWAAEIPAPIVVVPFVAVGMIAYLFLRRTK